MEEKTIVVGKSNVGWMKKVILVGAAIFALGSILYLFNFGESRVDVSQFGTYTYHYSLIEAMIPYYLWDLSTIVAVLLDVGLIIDVVFGILYFIFSRFSITVTDKRVYGKAFWGKRVDLPIDSVSGVAMLPIKGIAVATSSSSIWFFALKNFEEIHNEISKLLIERQKKTTASVISQTQQTRTTDELKELKGLLDSGILTQEEFDAKKKQILGI